MSTSPHDSVEGDEHVDEPDVFGEHGHDDSGHDDHGSLHANLDAIARNQERKRGRRRAAARRGGGARRLLPLMLVLLLIVGVGAGGYYGYSWITSNVSLESEADDYPGPGSGEALIAVDEGDTGTDIAKKLVSAGVIKSSGPFVTVFSNTPDAANIHPGTYRLKKQMTSDGALKLLLDPASLAGERVIIPEGMRASKIYERLSKQTGIPVEDFTKAAKDYRKLGVPENPAKSVEGYLWPGRYDIPEDATAEQVLTMMVKRMDEELTKLNVPERDRYRVLTLASIAEKETRSEDDYGKVVRTLDNRLEGAGAAKGHPMKLQLDSTVAYASGRDSISTTPQERASDSPYNTYVHEGLPIGPIANPGAKTIKAALNPPEGDWLFWVTVNTDTGETKFANTWAEHEKNVQQWKDWAKKKKNG